MAQCNDCHVEHRFPGNPPVLARRYGGTPKDCASCHKDVHHGQFRESGECSSCHVSSADWQVMEFDHDTQSRFPLLGVHATLSCAGCHRKVQLEDGSDVVHYRPMGRECGDCHEIPKEKSSLRDG